MMETGLVVMSLEMGTSEQAVGKMGRFWNLEV